MLEKMGWKKGEGLGKEGTGMKDPVRQACWHPGCQNQNLRPDVLPPSPSADRTENQDVPVRPGVRRHPVCGQHVSHQIQVPEELGEGA